MSILNKIIVCTIFLAAMYFGGIGTQSGSTFFQGVGFMGILIAVVCVYIILKVFWWQLNSFTRLLLIGGILLYGAFSIGLFNGNTIHSFLSGQPSAVLAENIIRQDDTASLDELGRAMFGDEYTSSKKSDTQNLQTGKIKDKIMVIERQIAEDTGIIEKIKIWFGNKQKSDEKTVIDLEDSGYPEVYGHPQVISAGILKINNVKIKLLGIDAPDATQTCANRYGNAYACGKKAIEWMQDFLNMKNVSCQILGKTQNDYVTGVCFTEDDKQDVAAAAVNAGWAVAYTANTRNYIELERQAAQAHRGLWEGSFYKPWDWRIIQNRKIKIKVKQPPKKFNFKEIFE